MAWQAWIDGQAEILAAPLADAATPINVSDDPANDWSPAIAVDRRRPRPRRLRQLPRGQLRRLPRRERRLRQRRFARSRWPARRGSRPGPAWRSTRRAGSGSATRNAPPTGARTSAAPSAAREPGSTAPAAVRVRCVDGERVLDVADPVADAARRRAAVEQPRPAGLRRLGPGLAALPPPAGSRDERHRW